jgi:hypothetical protein
MRVYEFCNAAKVKFVHKNTHQNWWSSIKNLVKSGYKLDMKCYKLDMKCKHVTSRVAVLVWLNTHEHTTPIFSF